jgi:hypothetical protein
MTNLIEIIVIIVLIPTFFLIPEILSWFSKIVFRRKLSTYDQRLMDMRGKAEIVEEQYLSYWMKTG